MTQSQAQQIITPVKHSKRFLKYMDTIQEGTVSEHDINGIRRAMHVLDRNDRGFSGNKTQAVVSQDEIDIILSTIHEVKPIIGKEQEIKSLAWLVKQYKTKLGSTKKNSPLSKVEISIIEQFSCFKLVDFTDISNNHFAYYVPVYRVISNTLNQSFDYHYGSYQSNSTLTIC